ncbi:hypothetical protein HCN44_003361 [Aphidius gifuensis]|uniref:Molybdenum cofactor sulfurase n=1 Tax=Aphidius gifuensis TaxID=684658 RepID=A0A834XWW8_APHGI|nr:molybdenum cofactor sulfurase 3 [Aphidius gifuensis]KAF7994271.1 hypothetical protein HCN44_003361 [Aphidius gifuensis]
MDHIHEISFNQVYDSKTVKFLNKEFSRSNHKCYLDHAGTTLYSNSQIKKNCEKLMNSVFPNPHTATGAGNETLDIIERTRHRILDFFKATSDEYSLIFTSGATSSLKIIAETFKFSNNSSFNTNTTENGHFIYLQDNHTSVLGMRDLVVRNGAKLTCLVDKQVKEIFNNTSHVINEKESASNSLFVYPAQSNFSGFKYPLEWINKIKNGALDKTTSGSTNWYILVDAAGFVGTNSLDLSIYKPDFICLSFYKMFGYPSGIGALIVKNTSANVLGKVYYGGGTVNMAHSVENFHIKKESLYQRYEDGTLPFHSIIALQFGLDIISTLTIDKISNHVFSLSKYLYRLLSSLRHFNGNPVVKIYADSDYKDQKFQGGIVTFNLLRSNGDYVGYMEALHMAELYKIQLRTGCFCNPGACQRHLNLSSEDVMKNYNAGYKCGGDKDLINGKPTGAIRVSFGFMSQVLDIETLMLMLKECFVDRPEIRQIPQSSENNTSLLLKQYDQKVIKQKINMQKDTSKLVTKKSNEKKLLINEKKHDCDIRNELKLSRLFIYPIKSCGAWEIKKSWILNSKGLEYDREWMIMTSTGECLTQKHNVNLCKIKPTLCPDKNAMKLDYPGMPTAIVPLNININTDKLCISRVCGHIVEGTDCGSEISEWLSLAIGRPNLRLIRQKKITEFLDNEKTSKLSFSSQAQFLMINEASIEWLIEQLPNDSDCNKETILHRFRGNIIVEGAEPFNEINWSKITIGKNIFEVEGACTRCQMICIDQETGVKTIEPLQLLGKKFHGRIKFGMYLTKTMEQSKFISINDPIICT